MKAIVRSEYGSSDCLRFEETAAPAVSKGEVLVKVRASSVNPYDWHMLRGEPYLIRMSEGLRRPKSHGIGIDMAGTVEALGEGVTSFEIGDEVFGSGVGTLAEFALANEDRLARKPAGVTFEAAASMPCAAVTALQGLKDRGEITPGQRVLINGAAGGVGTFAVQIAKSMGATVTGVCSTRNVELVKSIGADEVIDYTKEDFSRRDQKFDVVMDTVGNRSLTALRRALTKDGTLVLAAGTKGKWLRPVALMLKGVASSKFVHHRIRVVMTAIKREELAELAALVESGAITPVIDRSYSLSECAQAVQYLEEGHARGKVVVEVG
jgi:NADPH:quinone reductase-like Zn-dependent oxidoreductase